MHLPPAFITDLLAFLEQERPSKDQLARKKLAFAKTHKIQRVPSDIQILTNLNQEQLKKAKQFLTTKPTRTGSGVAPVAVMTKPMKCPHGKCTYCPGGPGSAFGDIPQSYTGHEPATMRGLRAHWDIYTQIFNRLEQYIVLGQNPEKVELILMGGTFPSYPKEYQDEVVRDIFKAMNDFSRLFYDEKRELKLDAFKEFFLLPGTVNDPERTKTIQENIYKEKEKEYETKTIAQLQEENESAVIKCIGFTIETRPSEGKHAQGLVMLEQGCTRVELGIQTTYDDVLEAVHRDHTVQDSIDSICDLRDLGFKLNFHLMLGLPGTNPTRDRESLKRIFTDPDFKPDMVKIYPCMVMPGTPLFYDFKNGKYRPYSTEQAADLIVQATPLIPEWVRVMRVQRDIPTKVTSAGVDRTNLRQVVEKKMQEHHVQSRDIRAREIKGRPINNYELQVIEYDAGNGKEFFIQVIEPRLDALIGFCRLRFPGQQLHPEITESTAIIRELHVYGKAIGVGKGEKADKKAQHKGFGRILVEKAEELCKQHNKDKLLVISGVGVRGYYKKLGYEQMGPYVGKTL